jgi:hypothetical protein
LNITVEGFLRLCQGSVHLPPSIVKIRKNGAESAFDIKKKHIFKKQLEFENVSLRAEVHPKICNKMNEAYMGVKIFFSLNGSCRVF